MSRKFVGLCTSILSAPDLAANMIGMSRSIVATDEAPAAVGAYSQAVVTKGNRTLYASGQLGLLPDSGEMVAGGVQAQARQALDNLGAVLRAADMGWEDVVRATIYLADMADFEQVNQVYAERFPAAAPARACVQAAGLPKGALVEIDAIAVTDDRP